MNNDKPTLSNKGFAVSDTTELQQRPVVECRSAPAWLAPEGAAPAARPDRAATWPILHKGEILLPPPAYYRRSYPWLAPYYEVTKRFLLYLDTIRYKKIRIEGLAFDDGDWDWINKTFPYPSRFNEGRIKATLAKLYLLDQWHKESQRPSTMMTLTTYHDWLKPSRDASGRYRPAKKVRDGWSIEKAFEILLENWRKLRWLMRYYLGPLSFVRVLEPHKMGYPHLHILLFHDIPDKVQAKIRGTWSNRYKTASWSHGLDFSFNPKGDIASPKNYLMKYIGKDFRTGDMSPCELVFNALLWKHHYRRIDSSRDLQSIMKWKDLKNEQVVWMETGVLDKDDEYKEIWKRDVDPRPDNYSTI